MCAHLKTSFLKGVNLSCLNFSILKFESNLEEKLTKIDTLQLKFVFITKFKINQQFKTPEKVFHSSIYPLPAMQREANKCGDTTHTLRFLVFVL